MDLYILEEGVPVQCFDIQKWGKRYESSDRTVKQKNIGPFWISTVFLGINHNFVQGPPVLWETMIFTSLEADLNGYTDRYTSRTFALKGHQVAVDKARKKLDNLARKKHRKYTFYMPLDGSPARYFHGR